MHAEGGTRFLKPMNEIGMMEHLLTRFRKFFPTVLFFPACLFFMFFAGCSPPKLKKQFIEEKVVLSPVWFGETDEIQHVFVVKNDSNQLLEILDTNSSCTCTNLTLNSHSIQPKGTIDLKMVSDIRGRRGLFSATTLLKMGNGTVRKLELQVDIYNHLEIEPSVFYFGKVAPSEECSQKFRLTAYSRSGIEIDKNNFEVMPNVDDFMVKLAPPVTYQLSDGIKKIEVDGMLSFTAQKAYGDGNFTFEASVRTEEGDFSSSAKAYWIVSGLYTVEPSSFFVNADNLRERKEFCIRLLHEESLPFDISRVSFENFEGVYVVSPSNEGGKEVLFSVKSVDLEGKYKAGACVVVIEDANKTQIQIPVLFIGITNFEK